MTKGVFALCLICSVMAGCAGAGGPRPTPTPKLRSPLDFPLYTNSELISTKSFTQVVSVKSDSNDSVFAEGNGKYTGHEVIASSPAAFGDLAKWVDHLSADPPAGYTGIERQSDAQTQTEMLNQGLDFAVFTKKAGKNTKGVLVIVMDPQRVNKRFGMILGMIGKYKALPGFLRGPIDDQAKQRFGMTITQATQPDSPIGAALSALDELEHKNARGIVVLDAQKV